MKKILTPFVKYAIDKAKRNRYIQNLFESPFELNKYPKMGEFKDSYGNSFSLLNGLRSKIRPGWERMLVSKKTEISKDYLLKQKSNGEIAVNKILPIAESLDKTIRGSKILEIGCHSGSTSFALSEYGAAEVIGTEFSGYKVESVETKQGSHEKQLVEVNDDLKNIRESLSGLFEHSERVSFIDDDICNSSLEPSSFDIICSWEVLEHLHDTEKAFDSIYKLLKKDGISIHEYNPFFCLNGGHSLCTLDFLWGHARLSELDFVKYLSEIRPNEKERAYSFYKKGLNRMTLQDLENQIKKAGLETVSIIPFTKEQHLRMIDLKTLSQTQQQYPNVTLMDLATPRVYVVVKK